MAASGSQEQFRLGFLTAIEDPERGYVGGLLITNRFGRPLEFQCTAPVKPNRTQQILYGPTLKPFVLGELIGRTLVEKAGVKPHLVLTEHDDLLDLRDYVSVPVASLSDLPIAKTGEDGPRRLKLGNQLLTFHGGHNEDRAEIERQAAQIPSSADLKEPFDRVREALTETIKAATAAR
jgi:hypothetical protein